MERTHVFSLEAWASITLLPRVALTLSRRRLAPERLHLVGHDDPRLCSLEFTVCCDTRAAERLRAQLARIVGLVAITMHAPAALRDPAVTPNAPSAQTTILAVAG